METAAGRGRLLRGGKILTVSRDRDSGAALRPVLAAAGFEVLEASGGEEALAQVAAEQPAVVLLHLDDRDPSGYLLCRLLREQYGELLPIVCLSDEKMAASDRVVALLLGADDYVAKPYDPSEIVARVRRLVARSRVAGREATPSGRGEVVDDFHLTNREQQVLALLLEGLTQAEIADELVISSHTVATHIQRILLKLGVHNRAQAVAKAAHAGWLVREVPPQHSPADVQENAEVPTQARES
jgi:DNA-binding NarL/FixJ family response regulator